VVASSVASRHAAFLAIDDTYLYWTGDSSIARMPLAGGSPETLVSTSIDTEGIAVDATSIYFATYFGDTVMQMPIGGGTPTTLVYDMGGRPFGVAVQGGTLYYTSDSRGNVYALPAAGGTPTAITPAWSSTTGSTGIGATATSIYWGFDYGALQEVAVGGGSIATLAPMQQDPMGVAVDDASVYWCDLYGGSVQSAPLGGGAISTIISGFSVYGGGIAVNATAIYWSAADSGNVGTIMRLAR
jgi:hypothetical protein